MYVRIFLNVLLDETKPNVNTVVRSNRLFKNQMQLKLIPWQEHPFDDTEISPKFCSVCLTFSTISATISDKLDILFYWFYWLRLISSFTRAMSF